MNGFCKSLVISKPGRQSQPNSHTPPPYLLFQRSYSSQARPVLQATLSTRILCLLLSVVSSSAISAIGFAFTWIESIVSAFGLLFGSQYWLPVGLWIVLKVLLHCHTATRGGDHVFLDFDPADFASTFIANLATADLTKLRARWSAIIINYMPLNSAAVSFLFNNYVIAIRAWLGPWDFARLLRQTAVLTGVTAAFVGPVYLEKTAFAMFYVSGVWWVGEVVIVPGVKAWWTEVMAALRADLNSGEVNVNADVGFGVSVGQISTRIQGDDNEDMAYFTHNTAYTPVTRPANPVPPTVDPLEIEFEEDIDLALVDPHDYSIVRNAHLRDAIPHIELQRSQRAQTHRRIPRRRPIANAMEKVGERGDPIGGETWYIHDSTDPLARPSGVVSSDGASSGGAGNFGSCFAPSADCDTDDSPLRSFMQPLAKKGRCARSTLTDDVVF